MIITFKSFDTKPKIDYLKINLIKSNLSRFLFLNKIGIYIYYEE